MYNTPNGDSKQYRLTDITEAQIKLNFYDIVYILNAVLLSCPNIIRDCQKEISVGSLILMCHRYSLYLDKSVSTVKST